MSTKFIAVDKLKIEQLLAFIRDFYEYERLTFNYDRAKEAVEALVENSSLGYAWLIYVDEIPIGYTVLCFSYSLEYYGRDAFVDELFLKAKYRGRGIGSQTLNFLEDICRSHGINAMQLEVDRGDPRAQAFYEKASFKNENRYLLVKWLSR